jgi:predicted transcriptional regulator
MKRSTEPLPRPTPAELEILSILWHRGPSSVREVHEVASRSREMGYTTVLKLLQIMTDKGLVRRDDSQRSHVYEASAPRERTRRQLVNDLVARAFEGSASQLVMHALSAQNASPEEIAEIRRLLDQIEGGDQ